MSATRAQYTEALMCSSEALRGFTRHLQTCPACRSVRKDCPTRDELYQIARNLDCLVEDIVAGWAKVRHAR